LGGKDSDAAKDAAKTPAPGKPADSSKQPETQPSSGQAPPK
jgi:hypothetical protein